MSLFPSGASELYSGGVRYEQMGRRTGERPLLCHSVLELLVLEHYVYYVIYMTIEQKRRETGKNG